MSHTFGNFGISIILSVLGSVVLLNWLVNDDVTESFLRPTVDEYKQAGINHLGIEFKDKSILLRIKLDKPMSCKQVFDVLDVSDLPLKGKLYSPVCTSVEPHLVIVVYKEKVSI